MVVHGSFQQILPSGQTLSFLDMSATAPIDGNKLWAVERLHVCPSGHFAFASYWATEGGADSGKLTHCTAVLQPETASPLDWVVVHVQKSAVRNVGEAGVPAASA